MVTALVASIMAHSISPADAMEVVHAERAFAKYCGEVGVRPSFLAFFSREAINFEPEPGPAYERLLSRPAPPTRTHRLVWDPAFAAINAAGDMGFTTGPSRVESLADGAVDPDSHGFYFSVWAKKPEGWRVLIDVGTSVPEYKGALKLSSPPDRVAPKATPSEELMRRDAKAAGIGTPHGRHLASVGSSDVVLISTRHSPMVGREAIAKGLTASTKSWTPAGAMVSSAGDFAFTYGKYELEGPSASGHYIRVWRRGLKGWKVIAQILEVPPPPS